MNLITICIDTLRKDHLGCFGSERVKTPNLDKFFEDAVIFDRFRMNAMPTMPLRRGLMLGRHIYPFKDEMEYPFGPFAWQPIGHREPTMAESFKAAGYMTGMVTDCYHYFNPGMNLHKGFHSYNFIRGQEGDPLITGPTHSDPNQWLDEKMAESGFRTFFEQYVRNVDNRMYEEEYFAPRVFTAAEQWLHRNACYYDKFFLHIDSFDPHEPWDPPKFYTELYNPGYKGKEVIFPESGPCDHLSESEINHIRALYAGKVTMVDRWFGHFMEKFELMGLAENTAVLVVSDHGILLGEHGLMKKGTYMLYSEVMEVPMMLKLPKGIPGQKRINGFIQECDIAPTMLKHMGVPVPGAMDGFDFWPLITGEKEAVRPYAAGAFGDHGYVEDDQYFYVRPIIGEGKARLYDMKADPAQENNLVNTDPDALKTMEAKFTAAAEGLDLPEKTMDGSVKFKKYVPLPVKPDGF